MNFGSALKTSLLIALGFWLGRLPFHECLLTLNERVAHFYVARSKTADVAPSPVLQDHQPPAVAAPQLSQYDDVIQTVARENNIDWRLVSSIIFVESSFKHTAKSHKGAQGLMQIMPVVAKEFGIKNIFHPETNISTGVKHLARWYKMLKGATHHDRLMFALAAFNGGPGHVQDAQKLAYRLKKNPLKWDHVKSVLPLLEHKLYNWDLSSGYCQGNDMVTYVDRIMAKYKHYTHKFPEEVALKKSVSPKQTS